MLWTAFHIAEILLWFLMAASVAYVAFFAIISLFYEKDDFATTYAHSLNYRERRFLILYPAYNEDSVIYSSVAQFLEQDYPTDKFQVVVISDHMTDDTNQLLRTLPITVLTPSFEKSSKAKAMQYAIETIEGSFDNVIVLDADNVVQPDFLKKLNILCNAGYEVIQCHRCAKNSRGDVAMLDGASEEINNTIFRKAHNRLGLSSALIGSGMCFTYDLFHKNVFQLSTAGEDREMEALLLRQGIFIKYAAEIHVLDEKVNSKDNFQRQRMRWMTAQVQSLSRQLPQVPSAFIHGNLNFIDKTIQQALIPRSMLVVLLTLISVLMTLIVPTWSVKWWILLGLLIISLVIAIPAQLRSVALFSKVFTIPGLVWRMLKNLMHLDRKNTEFLHTTHNSGD